MLSSKGRSGKMAEGYFKQREGSSLAGENNWEQGRSQTE